MGRAGTEVTPDVRGPFLEDSTATGEGKQWGGGVRVIRKHWKCSGLWKVYTVLHQNRLPLQLRATGTICGDPAHSPPGSRSTPTHLHDSIQAPPPQLHSRTKTSACSGAQPPIAAKDGSGTEFTNPRMALI